MKKVLLLLLFAFCANVSAQNEFLNKSNSITPLDKPNTGMMSSGTTNTNSVYTPNVFNVNKKTSSGTSTIPEKPVDMTTEKFANSGDVYKKQLNEKLQRDEIGMTRDRQAFKRDSNLGKFKTFSKFVTISYRDYGEIDQDFIKVLLNGETVKEMIYLEADYKTVQIDLRKGSNTIEFLALNTGLSFPNTAEFMVKDEQGSIITSNLWALDTGFKAIITVERN